MKILIAHNYYQQPGGEDAVVKSELEMLRQRGHEVLLFSRHNNEIEQGAWWQRLYFLWTMPYSRAVYRQLRRVLREFKPAVAHFHNIFYVMTPSVYDACRAEGVAVVQSQHNFRPLCANALFFRGQQVCEDCRTKSFWEGVRHKCFKNSRLMSALMARTLQLHQKRRTWASRVDKYITATEFTRQKFVQAGISPERIAVKPHFVASPAVQPASKGYSLYAGRLSPEKGVDVLLRAWEQVDDVPLFIIGDGPLKSFLEKEIADKNLRQVRLLGYVPAEEYSEKLRGAAVLIVPSVCYENFPRIIVEAYAQGIPVLASRLGSMAEIVDDGKTGMLFAPGDAADLARKVRALFAAPDQLQAMGRGAQAKFQGEYTEEHNYQSLMRVYREAIELKGRL